MIRRSICLAILCAALASAAFAASPRHALVELDLRAPGAQEWLNQHHLSLDILEGKPGYRMRVAADPADMALLRESGIPLKTIHASMEDHYAARTKGPGFGVFHTFSESVAWMDSLRMLYPNVISEKWSIGTTHEGRDIWCFRVSDNPDSDEDEPEVLIDGMHHAREIMASEFPVMFAEHLAQNYGTDAEITWLVNNRELYVIPIVNPDGFVYNEVNDPSGGGMWRKNRFPNLDGSYGVDPNRNYPYQWGYDDSGSSPYPGDITYRGSAPGSELEVQAMMAFIDGRNIRTHDSVHTYSNLTLIPWGYTTTPTPDHAILMHMAGVMTQFNGYAPGPPGLTLNYDVNGGSFDWVYGDLTNHDKPYTFSNEIGSSSDGFWPDESRREPLFQENLWPHIYLMRAANTFISVHAAETLLPVTKAFTPGTVEPGQTGYLSFTLANQSPFASALNVDVTLRTDDPWIQLGAATRSLGGLAALDSTTIAADPVPFTVDAACPQGRQVVVTATVHMAEGDLDFPLTFTVGQPVHLIFDDLEGTLAGWTVAGGWDVTSSTSYSPLKSLTDSPGGEYQDETLATATLNGAWPASRLRFWHRYDIESGYDYGRVEISPNGGGWQAVASYSGTMTTWSEVVIDLTAFAGQDVSVRFALDTDYSVTEDGWYVDDVALEGDASFLPIVAVPVPTSPVGGVMTGTSVDLTVAHSGQGPGVVHGFRVYTDALCTDLIAQVDDIAEEAGPTAWTVGPLTPGAYWWRAYAGESDLRTDLSQPENFVVDVSSSADLITSTIPTLRVLGATGGEGTRLELNLPARADVRLDIYDARGARVRRLTSDSMEPGTRVLTWDGRTDHGRTVASGVYLIRVQAGRHVLNGRVVLIR